MNKCPIHYTEQQLLEYLETKHLVEDQLVKKEIVDSCNHCWKIWNKIRWDKAKNSLGLMELREYLGEKFVEYYDSSWALANEWNELNPTTNKEIFDYYKNTENYLFNLVIWHESGDRPPLQELLSELSAKYNLNSFIDFGCGVGTDSLFLLEKQKKVFMTDLIGNSTKFLNWRVKKRGLEKKAFLVDSEKVMGFSDSDMFWAIDVLEHLQDPLSVLDRLPENLKIFAHRSQFGDDASGRHPSHLSFDGNLLNKGLFERGFVEIQSVYGVSIWVNRNSIV